MFIINMKTFLAGENMKKYKVIVDTDPGVDDTTALVYILNDPQFDIKLFSTVYGNLNVNKCTRNLCHILDIFDKDIPVVKGYANRISGSTEDATFLHTKEGLGGYTPPKNTIHQPIDMDCADAMYEVLKRYPKEVTILILGPHTNLANLLLKHPDAKDLMKGVLMMGGAPKGIKANPNHRSFNIRTDAPAFKVVVDSKVPIVMVPSSMGRDDGHLTEQHVETMKNMNDVGAFLAKTYETYWEPNYEDKRIATNDVAAVYYLTHPTLYTTRHADIKVDIKTGKTVGNFHRSGHFKVVTKLNRKKFLELLFSKLQKFKKIEIPQLHERANQVVEKPRSFRQLGLKGKQPGKVKSAADNKENSVKTAKTTKNLTKTTKKSVKTPKKTRKNA